METPIIHLDHVHYSYPGQKEKVLEDIVFKFFKGEKIGLIGPNGVGKTTFLHICMGLITPLKGKVFFKGKDINDKKVLAELRRSIGFVFQNPDDQLFCPTVLEDVAFGPLNLGLSPKEAKRVSLKALEKVGLLGFENRITHKLSGGEKKLLSIATVLAMNPEAILLDEPTTGLDIYSRQRIIDVIKKLDQSLIIVSHDWDFLAETVEKFYVLYDKKLYLVEKETLHVHYHSHPSGEVPHEHSMFELIKINHKKEIN